MADALSRHDTSDAHVSALSGPSFDLFEGLRQAAHTDPALVAFREKLENGELRPPWAIIDGLVTFECPAYIYTSFLTTGG
jgi:hypothetical protein